MTYILVIVFCIPSNWSWCGNGTKIERIENIPTLNACEIIASEFKTKDRMLYRSHSCIRQEVTR